MLDAKDVSIGVWAIVKGRNEVFEGGSGVVCELREECLRLGFSKRTHFGGGGWSLELDARGMESFWRGDFSRAV